MDDDFGFGGDDFATPAAVPAAEDAGTGPAVVLADQNGTEEPAVAAAPVDDVFAGMDVGGDQGGGGDDAGDAEAADGGGAEVKEAEDDVTFLSVWKEERQETLRKRAAEEREKKQKQQEEAKEEIKKFYGDRERRIETRKEDNKRKEADLRDDVASTFEHGSTWEQVGKITNLTDQKSGVTERMRTLLIHLKAGGKK